MNTAGDENRHKRLSREDWLRLGLEAIAKQGHARLRISSLVKSVGVTKGSFYWHFKDRADFVKSLAQYWATTFTFGIVEAVNQQKLEGSDRLWALMKILTERETARYDLAMRVWGAQEPNVAAVLAEVDKRRLSYIRSIFEEMGFEGDELQMRTRAFVMCQNSQYSLFLEETLEERLKDMQLRHAFFTRP